MPVPPAYRQVMDALRSRIASVEVGALLPSETQLMREFSRGRNTVRRAYKELASEGLVDIRQGRGAFRA